MNNIAIALKGIDKKFGLVYANRSIKLSVCKANPPRAGGMANVKER